MSGTLTAGASIRADVFDGVGTLAGAGSYNYSAMQTSDGSTDPVAAQADTYLLIDTVAGATPLTDLFVGTGFDAVENANDLAPIVLSAADTVSGDLVYQGDVGNQTVFGGSGTEFIALTGFGNTFAENGSGTYEIAAGLGGPTALQTLAAASGTAGNNIDVTSGNASIAAGLGANHIFLGSGTALVANEGSDTIVGGSGAATVDGGGAATIFAGTGSIAYDGAVSTATAVIVASSVAGAGNANVYGDAGSVTAYGATGDFAAYGGQAGNNVLVSGTANSTLVGGGYNDLLVASGAGTTTLVASDGNTTLFGANATGTTNYFLGGGADSVVAGTGNEYIQFGTGAATSTVFGSTGNDVYGVDGAVGGSTNLVIGFNTASDHLDLSGFGASLTAASFMNDVSTVDGSTFINLTAADGNSDVIKLYGVTDLSASNLILPSVSAVG